MDTICWQAFLTLDKATSKLNDSFRNSEWGPEAAEQMCKDVKDIPFKGGNGNLTLGDLIELSPKHLISKVVYEEKIFKTWFNERTTFQGKAARYILNNFPKWLIEKAAYDNVRNRPMIAFLPLVDDKGSVKASRQPSLEKTLAIMKKTQTKKSSASAI
ncbi:hypothetical protein BG005_010871 [Podila minutissima]|nr:hypothetical protein BG005_010871 [Podila minutissima]